MKTSRERKKPEASVTSRGNSRGSFRWFLPAHASSLPVCSRHIKENCVWHAVQFRAWTPQSRTEKRNSPVENFLSPFCVKVFSFGTWKRPQTLVQSDNKINDSKRCQNSYSTFAITTPCKILFSWIRLCEKSVRSLIKFDRILKFMHDVVIEDDSLMITAEQVLCLFSSFCLFVGHKYREEKQIAGARPEKGWNSITYEGVAREAHLISS